jgi:hypothetical protein
MSTYIYFGMYLVHFLQGLTKVDRVSTFSQTTSQLHFLVCNHSEKLTKLSVLVLGISGRQRIGQPSMGGEGQSKRLPSLSLCNSTRT